MVQKRDAEIARLRDQRDQQMSELNERKQKDHVKIASLNEFKALAETRSASSSLPFPLCGRIDVVLGADQGFTI